MEVFKAGVNEENLLIEVGMRLEAIRANEQLVFLGRVKELKGTVLKLANDAGDSVPPAVYGTEVKLRGVWPRVGLVTYHGTVYGCTADSWMIGDLQEWYGWERRSFYRQSVSIDASVLCTYRAILKTIEIESKVPCQLRDISASGAMLACSREVYSVGDLLSVTDAVLIPGEKPISFHCEVKRIERARTFNLYGCEFHGMSIAEQDVIARAVFRLQQEERKRSSGSQ